MRRKPFVCVGTPLHSRTCFLTFLVEACQALSLHAILTTLYNEHSINLAISFSPCPYRIEPSGDCASHDLQPTVRTKRPVSDTLSRSLNQEMAAPYSRPFGRFCQQNGRLRNYLHNILITSFLPE